MEKQIDKLHQQVKVSEQRAAQMEKWIQMDPDHPAKLNFKKINPIPN